MAATEAAVAVAEAAIAAVEVAVEAAVMAAAVADSPAAAHAAPVGLADHLGAELLTDWSVESRTRFEVI